MDLYRMNDDRGLPPDDFCAEMFQPISDVLQLQLPDHSPSSAAAAMSGANLGDIPVPCRTEEISSGSDGLSFGNKWDADPDLTGAESSKANKSCNGSLLQAAVLDCKVCGKVFSTTSSLNKHYVTHNQERSHICKVCKKAFKRQDHLMGHMLTHLEVKPFACTEPTCNKSYCDFRSLRRHYEVHHGLWTQQQKVPSANPSKVLETVSAPPVLPNDDLIRCLVSEILQQKVTSNMVVMQDPKGSHAPPMMTLHTGRGNEDFAPMNAYTFAPLNTCTLINSTSKVSMDADYVGYSDPSVDNAAWNLPPKIQSMQQNSYSTGSFDGTAVNGGFIEPPHSFDHKYASPPVNNGRETMSAQYSFTHETDFTRLSIQPYPNAEFQVQNPANFFIPMTNPQSHTAALSLLSMSIPQCIPETNGVRSWGDLQREPQGLPSLPRIIRGTDNGTLGSHNGPATVQPGPESQKATYGMNETWPKLGRSHHKSATTKEKLSLSLSSTVLASQVALESFTALDKSQGNEELYQGDFQEGDMGSWPNEGEATAQSVQPGTWTTKDTTAGRLVIPVSVPVTKKDQQTEDKVSGIRSHPTTKTGKKMRPSPKPLYIPPPVLEKNSTSSSGSFRSSMRSPDSPLSEYLYNGALQCQYTPPPMLSPIRQGTGLYFNTFHTTSSAKYQPPSLDEKDTGGPCLVKDLRPHINIGDQFQAVIPERRDRAELERGEEKADLVWRPCLHTTAMSHLLNLACSSAVPGGGCNLELALHCLHFSQGNVLEALDKLFVKENWKRLPRCLANYHYAGSDLWSAPEKRQFKNAYHKQRKNFCYIQSVIPGKSVHQCVEYYYTWKKIISFERRQTPASEQALSTEQSVNGEKPREGQEPHTALKPKNKNPKKEAEPQETTLYTQTKTGDREEPSTIFPCQECDRVFEKVKSRNAHMKKHRLQEERERILLYESRKQSIW